MPLLIVDSSFIHPVPILPPTRNSRRLGQEVNLLHFCNAYVLGVAWHGSLPCTSCKSISLQVPHLNGLAVIARPTCWYQMCCKHFKGHQSHLTFISPFILFLEFSSVQSERLAAPPPSSPSSPGLLAATSLPELHISAQDQPVPDCYFEPRGRAVFYCSSYMYINIGLSFSPV